MDLDFTYDAAGITITPLLDRPGLLGRLLRRAQPSADFDRLSDEDEPLVAAMAELRAFEESTPGAVTFSADRLQLSHDAAASLSAPAAHALGLPGLVHLTLRTDVSGSLGSPDFRLRHEWTLNGQRQNPTRTGALIRTGQGLRRIPLWMKRALDLAEDFDPDAPLEAHWAALAGFRHALEPGESPAPDLAGESHAPLAMTAFLRGLEVRLADRFSISPDNTMSHFDVIPYSSQNLGIADDDLSEANSDLDAEGLAAFQYKLATSGAGPAYHLGGNRYLVIDPSAAPVLREIARARRLPREARKEFVQNPRAFIARAVAQELAETVEWAQFGPAGQEEMVEGILEAGFVESREYSERVTGLEVYTKAELEISSSGTTWLPEVFTSGVMKTLAAMTLPELRDLGARMEVALAEGVSSIDIGGKSIPLHADTLGAVRAMCEVRAFEEGSDNDMVTDDWVEEPAEKTGPLILGTRDNYEELTWHARLAPRISSQPDVLPSTIRTALKPHQVDSFAWQVAAWRAGLPGILNADEQGLGKTLQTIAFLTWLKRHMQDGTATRRGPVLIVAPTSLLVNWEEEVARHVEDGAFGHLVRLYGSAIPAGKRRGAQGKDTDQGLPLLDLDWLDEALHEGRAHRYWFLTTYTTLANYQHSLGSIPFSAMVCDEIQAIKNPITIRSRAVEAMNADFRIGLTGTPIENTTLDLWTVMDRLAPGSLGTGREFRDRYEVPDEANMAELYARLFRSVEGRPPLALRRLKDEVATDLPTKTRRLHPRVMPRPQSEEYEKARGKLMEGGKGAALKMLHHIRSVSVHPGGQWDSEAAFIGASGRMAATFDILDRVRAAGERALVFIEHRDLQFHFAELARQRYRLPKVGIINGDTPILRRQQIVNAFQENLPRGPHFDLLVLGPKAAGTGLTLTAATHVIHLSRWWNPAVEEQCNDRIHRIGQTKPVTIHLPMAIHPGFREGSFDCLLHSLMQRKRRLAQQALWPMGDLAEDAAGLQQGLQDEAGVGTGDPVQLALQRMFDRDGIPMPQVAGDGSYVLG